MGAAEDVEDSGRHAELPRSPLAAGAVPRMTGYRMPPMPGVHRGLPSPYLTLVFSLSGELPIEVPAAGAMRPGTYGIPVGGLHTRPVLLPQDQGRDGRPGPPQRGIQLAVHPLAARALFGLPASELTGQVLELRDVVGGVGGELTERLTESIGGRAAARLVMDWVDSRLSDALPDRLAPELHRAFALIVESAGRCRIADVADDVGWSRRHLTARLRAETGLGAKDLARVTRFQQSRSLLVTSDLPLAQVAATCGYTDQPHLTAEWREFAGCTPGQWIAAELPSLLGQHLEQHLAQHDIATAASGTTSAAEPGAARNHR
jgi:AraC-like DNA-binding protein